MSEHKKCIVCNRPIEQLMIANGFTLCCAACHGRKDTVPAADLKNVIKAYKKRRDLNKLFPKRRVLG